MGTATFLQILAATVTASWLSESEGCLNRYERQDMGVAFRIDTCKNAQCGERSYVPVGETTLTVSKVTLKTWKLFAI